MAKWYLQANSEHKEDGFLLMQDGFPLEHALIHDGDVGSRIVRLLNEAEPDGEIKKAADLLFTTPGGHGYTVDTLWSLVAKK